jgi:hypothetical protein
VQGPVFPDTIPTMGRLLVILLVMLLPLRGWSAERMAIQMTSSQVAIEIAGEQVSLAAMPEDCPMLAQQAVDIEKSPSPSKSLAGCQTCQLCMSLAGQIDLPSNISTYERQAPPVIANVSYVSADLARLAKPPIL